MLKDFFAPFSGTDPAVWPKNEVRLIAINEGRLVDFLAAERATFPLLSQIVSRGLASGAPEHRVAVVNLNLRSVVADAMAGQQTRLSRPGFAGWLYSRDAAAGLATLVDAAFDEPAPVFDLGGPEVFSVEAFCAEIAPAFPGWSHAIDPAAPTVRYQIPADKPGSDFERLKAATGFAPRFGLKAAAADYLAWLGRV